MTDKVEELKQLEKIRSEMESKRSKQLLDNVSRTLDGTSSKVFTKYIIGLFVYLGVLTALVIAFCILSHGDAEAVFEMGKFLLIPVLLILLSIGVQIGSAKYHKELKNKVEKNEIKKNEIVSKIEWLEEYYSNQYKKLTAIEPEYEEEDYEEDEGNDDEAFMPDQPLEDDFDDTEIEALFAELENM